ncbi:MAG: radical SAM protein [Bryobacteraceae bacterium]
MARAVVPGLVDNRYVGHSCWYSVGDHAVRSALSRTSGFIAAAGFTHSLTPARNCTYGCVYCYVPTMRLQGGLQPEDWRRWGQRTSFKTNAPQILATTLRPDQSIYCSPLTDPYQPAEQARRLMPEILEAIAAHPPRVFAVQTRSPLVLRDLDLLRRVAERTTLRISFSLTTDRDEVRRLYEPHCASIAERVETIGALRRAGLIVHATLAPILPCDPAALARLAVESTVTDVLGDPFHVRAVKRHGATTRPEAEQVSAHHGFSEWHDPAFQCGIAASIGTEVERAGRRFALGTEAFQWLAR